MSVSFISTTSEKVNGIEKKAGQIIFSGDDRAIYLDTAGDNRTCYKSVIVLETDTNRRELGDPIVDAIYLVKEDKLLWTYQSGTGWGQLTSKPESSIQFVDQLPQSGEDGTLYVTKSEIYRYDTDRANFVSLGGGTGKVTWGNIKN